MLSRTVDPSSLWGVFHPHFVSPWRGQQVSLPWPCTPGWCIVCEVEIRFCLRLGLSLGWAKRPSGPWGHSSSMSSLAFALAVSSLRQAQDSSKTLLDMCKTSSVLSIPLPLCFSNTKPPLEASPSWGGGAFPLPHVSRGMLGNRDDTNGSALGVSTSVSWSSPAPGTAYQPHRVLAAHLPSLS
ncbi:hypothetical protein B0J11DRAFT_315372 [Dendryphion nanum]|uniref:Uncharacterized protein n=1 Tax=Dendryphion nanum TaxID=256645 RepID=A0A9P9IKF1_9PLEO|nr:hypothetical protein B0J11DRAFT_315372 [Dendryphion nanum]